VSVTTAVYSASPIRRHRRTKAEMTAIRESLYAILADDHPQTVRGTFYQATVAGSVPKTDAPAEAPAEAPEKTAPTEGAQLG